MQTRISKKRLKLNIAENLRLAMVSRELNQSELGRISHTSQVLIHNLLNQKLVPNAADLANVADALEITVDSLIQDPPKLIPKKLLASA